MPEESVRRLRDSLERLKTQKKNPLTTLLESVFQGLPSDLAEATKHCAIPRWFNADLIIALSVKPMSQKQAEIILDKINNWEFVQDLGNGHFAYRREIRNYLRNELKEKSAENFRVLNERCHSYFDTKLQIKGIIGEMIWVQLRGNQISYLREKVYHLLQIDIESGFSIFQKLFRGAHRLFLLGEASALLKFVQDLDKELLNRQIRDNLTYFEAMQQNADGDLVAAEDQLIDLQAQSLSQELKAQVLTLLGNIYYATNRLDTAVEIFQQAQEISNFLQPTRQSAALSNNLGNVYLAKRDLLNAARFFQQALAEFQRLGAITDQAQVLNNLGTIYLLQENWKAALNFFEKSLALKIQAGDQFGMAITRLNIGTLQQQLSLEEHDKKTSKEGWQKALDNYLASLDAFRIMGGLSYQAATLYKLALFYHQAGEDNVAKRYLGEALPIFGTLRLKDDIEKASPLARSLGLQV